MMTAFIPCLAYAILNRAGIDYITLLAQSVVSTAIVGGISVFAYHTTKDEVVGFVLALVLGALSPKFVRNIAEKYLKDKLK